MPDAEAGAAGQTAELIEVIRQIRERVRARHPQAAPGEPVRIAPADLMPLLHARDRAQAKVAAIGTVNPRPPGPLNALIQAGKRLVARLLDWHVREQVEFNRGVIACVNATLEAMNELNRALGGLAAELGRQVEQRAALEEEARRLRDIRSHWSEWRTGWEQKLAETEIRHLRAVAELQAAFEQRVGEAVKGFEYRLAQAESAFRALAERQHADFMQTHEQSSRQIQDWVRDEFALIRTEFERLIWGELRAVRQRLSAGATLPPAFEAAREPRPAAIDWLRFAERFRGSEEFVKASQRQYVEEFRGCRSVVDLGCGRGEFLELLAEAGVPARGVDSSAECVALARAKGLEVEQADLFAFLAEFADGFLDGIFCSHVIEHLPPERLPELIRLAAAKLCRDGLLVIETPNPACLASLALYFYADPTHVRPVAAPLLTFYLEEAGFGSIEIRPLALAAEALPGLTELPEDVRRALFGGLDYAALARRL